MRILFVTTDFMDKGHISQGGLASYLYRVSKALIKFNHTPVILTFGSRNNVTDFEGIKVHCITRKNAWLENNIYVNTIKSNYLICRETNRLAEKEKIDIVQFTSLQGLGMFYKNKIPAIVRLSSYAKIAYRGEYIYNKYEIAFLCFLEQYTAKKMQGVFGPSKITADALAADINRKIPVIETPFCEDKVIIDNSSYEENLKGKKYILYFGTLLLLKGVLNIADCVGKIVEKHPDYYFVFVGKNIVRDGKMNIRNEILQRTQKYQDHVILLQSLPHEKLYPIIEHAELVVLPSLMENFSNACIEAMNLRKIVIGTRGASFEQLIEDGRSGFLTAINDSDLLGETIEKVMNLDAETKKEIEKNAGKRIELLKPEIVVKRLLNYYRFVISRTKK